MFIRNRKEEVRHFQKRITGFIKLSNETVLLNMNNRGLIPWDYNWDHKDKIILLKGTEVKYVGQETEANFWHTIYYETPDGRSFYREEIKEKSKEERICLQKKK